MISRQRKEMNGGVKERRQSNIEYKELGVQRKTSEKTSGLICGSIFY